MGHWWRGELIRRAEHRLECAACCEEGRLRIGRWGCGGEEKSADALRQRVEGALRWEESQERAEGRRIVDIRVAVVESCGDCVRKADTMRCDATKTQK
jgi:hypothetical protein